jgi:hypothetical protein
MILWTISHLRLIGNGNDVLVVKKNKIAFFIVISLASSSFI